MAVRAVRDMAETLMVFGVQPLLNPHSCSMTGEVVCFARAEVLSWGNK